MPDLDTLLRERPTFTLDALADAANELLDDLLPRTLSDARVKAEVNPRLIRHYASEAMLDPALRDGRHAVYTVDHLLQLLALRRLLADGYGSSLIGSRLRGLDRDQLRAVAEGREVDVRPHAPAGTVVGVAREDDPARSEARDPSHAPADTPASDARGPGGAPAEDAHASVHASADASARDRARAALDAIRAGTARGAPPAGDVPAMTDPAVNPLPLSARDDAAWWPPPGAAPGARASPPEGPLQGPRTWERVPLLDGVELHVRSDLRLPDSIHDRQRLLDHVVRELIRYAQRRDA